MDSVKNIFAIPELRKRVLFTFGLLAVYRLGSKIPTPGINAAALKSWLTRAQGTMFGLYDMFSGNNLSQMTIFALGIMPYISASIILQLLTVVWPYLERLSKEGDLGRRKITQYTRYGTIVLSIVQALGIAFFLEANTNMTGGLPLVFNPGLGLPADDHPDADHRLGVRDVARRADYRTRHRQRHVAADLRRHRRRTAQSGVRRPSSSCRRVKSGSFRLIAAGGDDGAGRGGHRLRRTRAPARSPCSTRGAWWAGGCMAAPARTFR